jgi:hypothetical protein
MAVAHSSRVAADRELHSAAEATAFVRFSAFCLVVRHADFPLVLVAGAGAAGYASSEAAGKNCPAP